MITSAPNVSDVPKCRLCKNADASSIGSHIINRELINWVINTPGEKNKADKESAFFITPGYGADIYFGRNTGIEVIEKILGNPMTEEEFEENKNKHKYVIKYFLCAQCEKRLERIESYFMRNVHDSLRENRFKLDKIEEDFSLAQAEGLNSIFIRLYCYSIVWRCLEAQVNKQNYDNWFKEYLRNTLDKNLSIDVKDLTNNAQINADSICRFPLILNYLTTSAGHDGNHCFNKFKNPYFVLAGDIAIQLFSNRQAVKCYNYSLFGVDKFKKIKPVVNKGQKPFKIGVISENFRKKILLLKIARHWAVLDFKETKDIINKIYVEFFKKTIRDRDLNREAAKVILKYTDRSLPLGVLQNPHYKLQSYFRYFMDVIIGNGNIH